jgi:hypothetical protein
MDLSDLITTDSKDLTKQDVLQLLQVGLRENQPFARYFADTVLQDIQRKFKDIKIQSTAIEVDGKAISEDINNRIQTGISKDVDNLVKDTKTSIKKASPKIEPVELSSKKASKKEKISPAVESKSVDSPGMSIPSFLGVTPKMSLLTQVKYQSTVRALLDKIGLAVKGDFQFKEASISDILRPPGSKLTDTVSYVRNAKKWDTIQTRILSKVSKSIPDNLEFKQISLGDIFRPPNVPGAARALGAVGDIKRYFRWGSIQNTLLDSIETAAKKPIAFEKKITFSQIFGSDEKSSILSALKWNKLQNTIIEKVKKSSDNFTFAQEKPKTEKKEKTNIPVLKSKPSDFKSLEEKEPTVKVSGFTKDAIRDLHSLPGLNKMNKVSINQEKDKKGSGLGVLGTLGLVGVGLLGGGLLAQVTSIFNDGPFKGMQKAVGNIMTNIGKSMTTMFAPFLEKQIGGIFKGITKSIAGLAGLFSKTAAKSVLRTGKAASTGLLKVGGTFLKGILKKLPIIGTVISLGSAFSRIAKGDFIGGLLDIASGIASIVPVAGTAISIAIDLFSAGRDLKTGGSAAAGQGKINKSIYKVITEKLQDIPIIGGIIKLVKGIGALSVGDWKMAGIYLASIIPGLDLIFTKDNIDKIAINAPTKSFSELFMDGIKSKIKSTLKALPAFVKNPIYKMLGMTEEAETVSETSLAKQDTASQQTDSRSQKKQTPVQSVPKVSQEPAFDFIWRKGQPIQKFTQSDNVIATKDDKMFSKLADVLKSGQEKTQKNAQYAEQTHIDITKLIVKINNVIDAISRMNTQSAPSIRPEQPIGQLAGILSDAGDMRDPAYVLRSRAWDRIRKGYVVI